MSIIHATEENFYEKFKEGKVLVDFFAEWCGPCKMIAPILEQIAAERNDVTIIKVNVDEVESAARTYNIMSIPAILFFDNGVLKDTTNGFQSKDMLMAFIDKNM